MSLSFRCPRCSRKFRVAEKTGGKWTQCPACEKRFRIPIKTKKRNRRRRAAALVGSSEFLLPLSDEPQTPPSEVTYRSTHAVPPKQDDGEILFDLPLGASNRRPLILAGITVVILLIGLVSFFWLGDKRTLTTPTDDAIPPVGVPDLLALYSASEEVADSQYKGKSAHITGVVESVDLTAINQPSVVFQSGSEFGAFRVECQFDRTKAEELAKVRPGGRQVIRGKVIGIEKKTPPKPGEPNPLNPVFHNKKVIVLKDCSLE